MSHTRGELEYSVLDGTNTPATLFIKPNDGIEVDIAVFEKWEQDWAKEEMIANAKELVRRWNAFEKQQPPASKFTADMRLLIEQFGHLSRKYSLEVCDRLDGAEAINKDLLEVCLNSPSADMFVSFANFAEQCTEKPSMAIYKGRFLGLATFLRSCVDRAEKMEAAIAKAKKEG